MTKSLLSKLRLTMVSHLTNKSLNKLVVNLAYEIDTEIVDMLYKAAFARKSVELEQDSTYGVSKFEHYNGIP